MELAKGPIAAELQRFEQMLAEKGIEGGSEFVIFTLGVNVGARTAVGVLARRDPIAIAMLATELREFDEETRSAQGRKMDMVPDAGARPAAEAPGTPDALPAMTLLNGDDNGNAADGRAENGEGPAQRVRGTARSRRAAQAADVPRSAGEGRASD